MPNAVLDTSTTTRVDLKTCPGGFVLLKRMSYGDILKRRELQLKMTMSSGPKTKGFEGEMQLTSSAVSQFEFAHCIVDHNLEDASGRKLNLTSAADFIRLDPQIGQEIEKAIEDQNNYEGDEDFTEPSGQQLSLDGNQTEEMSFSQ
jgi:hypothetical protein